MTDLNLRQLARISRAKLERLQHMKLRATAHHLIPHVPYYKKLFKEYNVDPQSIRTIHDWTCLPLLKKTAYKRNPKDFIVRAPKEQLPKIHLRYLRAQQEYSRAFESIFSMRSTLKKHYQPHMLVFSGGTESGKPTPVFLTKHQKNELLGILQLIGQIALGTLKETRTVGMNLFPYAPHLGWHAVHEALNLNADLNLNTAAGGAMPSEQTVRIAKQLKPNIICGMNRYLRNRWLPLAIKNRVTLPERVLFVNGAQKMIPEEREQIRALSRKLGVKHAIILDLYGASELKEALLPECKAGSGYHHLAPLSTIIKTINVKSSTKELITDWTLSEDNGYVATWNIDGAGTLLEGYLLGDHIEKTTFGCDTCKLNVPIYHNINRIRNVQAQLRMTGMVEAKIKGTRIDLSALRQRVMRQRHIKTAQILIKKGKNDALIIHYVPTNAKKAKQELQKLVRTLEVKPTFKQVTLEKIDAYKEGIRYEQ